MARRAFFSFHYERDVWRASVVRNSWVTKPDREAAGFFDAGIWEEAKKRGDAAIKKLIDDALVGTTVTAVLIGAETSTRMYVKYEIDQSVARGMRIPHTLRLQDVSTDRTRQLPRRASDPARPLRRIASSPADTIAGRGLASGNPSNGPARRPEISPTADR